MANIKSAKKRAKTNEVRRQRNVSRASDVKSVIKKVEQAVADKHFEVAQSLFRLAEGKIARAAHNGIMKKNTASRRISRLARHLATAEGRA